MFRISLLVLFAFVVLACDTYEAEELRFDRTTTCVDGDGDGDGDGDPADPEHVCTTTDSVYVFRDGDQECDVGYWHACWVGEYLADGDLSFCCDLGGAYDACEAIDFDSDCPLGYTRMCDK